LLKTAPTIGARLLGLTARTPIGKIAEGAASGAGLAATDAALRGNDPIEAAKYGAALGGAAWPAGRALGAVAGKIGDVVAAPARRAAQEAAAGDVLADRGVSVPAGAGGAPSERLTEGGQLSTEALRDVARAGYKSIDSTGAQLKSDYVNRTVGAIIADLERNNFRSQYQSEIFNTLDGLIKPEIRPPSQFGDIMAGKPVQPQPPSFAPTSFGDIQAARMRLNDVIRESPGTAKATAAEHAKSELDHMLENIGQNDIAAGSPTKALRALQDANNHWALVKRSELYQGAIERAQRQAASNGIGGNIDNALRQQFKSLRNGKLLRNAPQDEMDVIDAIIAGTPMQNVARAVGRLSPVGHSLPMMLEVGGALAGGHLPAAGIAVTGHAAKMIADAMTRARAARLSQLVRSKAPASIEMRQRLPVRPSVDPRLALIARAAQIGAYRAARQQQQ
jgi:hypothetical protein